MFLRPVSLGAYSVPPGLERHSSTRTSKPFTPCSAISKVPPGLTTWTHEALLKLMRLNGTYTNFRFKLWQAILNRFKLQCQKGQFKSRG